MRILVALALAALCAPAGRTQPLALPCQGMDARACRSELLANGVPIVLLSSVGPLARGGAPTAVVAVAAIGGAVVGPAVGLVDAGLGAQAARGMAVRAGALGVTVGLLVLLIDPDEAEGFFDFRLMAKGLLIGAPGAIVWALSVDHDVEALRQRLRQDTARRARLRVASAGGGAALVVAVPL